MIVSSKGKNQIKKIEGDLYYLSTRKNQSTLLFNDWCFPPPPQQKTVGSQSFLSKEEVNKSLLNQCAFLWWGSVLAPFRVECISYSQHSYQLLKSQ